MTARVSFTKAQVRRAVEAVQEGGFEIGRVEIAPDGTLRILPKETEPTNPEGRKPEEW